MPAELGRIASNAPDNRSNPRLYCGKFGAARHFMLASFQRETSMKRHICVAHPEAASDPLARLEAMIALAQADLIAADAEVDAVTKELAAVEPHPHAHGYTAAGDCAYAGIEPEHFLPLAGLLAQPWAGALAAIEAARYQQEADYLLRAFPALFAAAGDALSSHGAMLIDARADRVDGDLTALFARKPRLAVGMVWRLFGFDRRDRDSWVGAFAFGVRLSALVASTEGVATTTALGDALAAAAAAHSAELAAMGRAELHARAARRDAERQASWAALPEDYRLAGSWRGRAPTRRQRNLMQRIEKARGLPMPVAGRRGASADAITGAGGNPRFDNHGEDQA